MATLVIYVAKGNPKRVDIVFVFSVSGLTSAAQSVAGGKDGNVAKGDTETGTPKQVHSVAAEPNIRGGRHADRAEAQMVNHRSQSAWSQRPTQTSMPLLRCGAQSYSPATP